MRELSSLVDMPVIAFDEGKRLGTISQTLVDLSAGELVAVLLAGPPGKSLIMSQDFKVFGDDALMVQSADVLKSRAEVEEDLARSRDVLANPPMVLTDKGTRLGVLSNVYLADDGRIIVRYGISGGPLRDLTTGPVALPILKGTVHGQDAIIVPHDAAHKYLAEAAGGIKGSLDKLGRIFRQKYEEISERSSELYHESEEKLRERAGELAQEARQKLKQVADQDEQAEDGEQPDIEAAKQELQAARESRGDDENDDQEANEE